MKLGLNGNQQSHIQIDSFLFLSKKISSPAAGTLYCQLLQSPSKLIVYIRASFVKASKSIILPTVRVSKYVLVAPKLQVLFNIPL